MVDAVDPFLPTPIYKLDKAGTKTASPDLVISEDPLPKDVMLDYVFALVGGQEILEVSRRDLIDSPYNDNYTPLLDAGTAFDNELPIRFTDASPNIFSAYGIDLNDHVPQGIEVETGKLVKNVESDPSAGTITINLKNLKENYVVEVEVIRDGKIINDIIDGGDY